jgi:hypothetical protein
MCLIAASLFAIPLTTTAHAQSAQAQAQASSRLSAELVKGRLNPATSKPGDRVTVRTKEDLKANGQVILKKGSELTGVVRSVKRVEGKAQSKSDAAMQSMMQIEWSGPASQQTATASQQLNIALQSVAYTSPIYAQQQQDTFATPGIATSRPAPARAGGGGGLAGGLTGAVSPALGTVNNIGTGVTAGATSAVGQRATLNTSVAVAPVNAQTATSIESNFGESGNQLLMVGRGQTISSGGSTVSMDIFSHMSNDTVITSPSRDFEIGTGAEMQFMVNAS